jgi:ABC-2 type transport system permease protein
MNNFISALWAETLKAQRAKVLFFSLLGFSMAPLAGGLFTLILKNPEAARSLGVISAKAQLTTGSADWPAFFRFQAQAVAAGGMVIFSIVTSWVFGREFSDHTVKELLALPTARGTIVSAKFALVAAWAIIMTLTIFSLSVLVGTLVVIPGWSTGLLRDSFVNIFGAAVLTIPLMSFVALIASSGRGYLPAFSWIMITLVLANIAGIMGWGDWFPWAVPGLFSGAAGPRAELLGTHSYMIVLLASLIGLFATFYWWRNADHTR